MLCNTIQRYFNYINFLWFQGIWLIAVLYQQQAVWVMVLSLLVHFTFTQQRRCDLFAMVSISLLGSLADSLLLHLGVLQFADTHLLPLWLVLLWAHFALTLNHAMYWLSQTPRYVQALMGGIFGSFSYYAGAQFAAVDLNDNLALSLFGLVVIWATMTPVYIAIILLLRGHTDAQGKRQQR